MKTEKLDYLETIRKPIPLDLPSVAGWKEVPIKPARKGIMHRKSDELLVPIGPFSDYNQLFTNSIYAGERNDSPYPGDPLKNEQPLKGSLITMFLRKTVAHQLMTAQVQLPEKMWLIILDAYRTLDVQNSLFEQYLGSLKIKYPEWTYDQLLAETQKYVSLPSTNPTRPSPHNTGGCVDVSIFTLSPSINQKVTDIDSKLKSLSDREWTQKYNLEMERISLIKNNAKLLEFGVPFDYGGEEAALNYYERVSLVRELTPLELEAKNNRRFLYHLMTSVGFQAYPDEIWHYNCLKTQMGAKTADKKYAEYGAIDLSEENIKHELMRQNHRLGTIRLSQGIFPGGKLIDSIYLPIALKAAQKMGDYRKTSIPLAEIISAK